jgi:ABC-2 type transport system permease protein
MHELNAILAIAHRDLTKLLRDRPRMLGDLAFPVLFVALLGPALQAGFGSPGGLDLQAYVFSGVLAQSVWQSAAAGVISLIADREQDFSQEIFVSPISRYSIVMGKIVGESLVAFPQALAILALGVIIGVPVTIQGVMALIPVIFLVAVFGGAFGILVVSNLASQRAANQVFTFLLLPQFFLAGVFNPIQNLPGWLEALSRISPLRYAVDTIRNVYYGFQPSSAPATVASLETNLAVMAGMLVVFVTVGTAIFVRSERNR